MVVKTGDESHGRSRKTSPTKQVQDTKELLTTMIP